MGLGLDGFLVGWGGVLAESEGGFGLGWILSWMVWCFSSG